MPIKLAPIETLPEFLQEFIQRATAALTNKIIYSRKLSNLSGGQASLIKTLTTNVQKDITLALIDKLNIPDLTSYDKALVEEAWNHASAQFSERNTDSIERLFTHMELGTLSDLSNSDGEFTRYIRDAQEYINSRMRLYEELGRDHRVFGSINFLEDFIRFEFES